MVAILGANSVSGGYEVSNSLRFNDNDSPRLTFTPSSAGNRKTFTLSVWFKLQAGTTGERVLLAADDGTGGNNNFDYIAINGNDKIFLYNYEGGEAYVFTSTQVLRDPSAWYHLVVAFDTTQGTNTNRVKIYLNGSQITAFDTSNYPTQNFQTRFNNNNAQRISSYPDQNSSYFDGYMCEYHLVDGSQLAPTSFGEFDDNGVWIPIKYTGSYGTNGFFLEFKQTGTSQNSSGIGADTSGNDNHFAVTNLAATDITEDTCTNNFATLNPLDGGQTAVTLEEGNTLLNMGTWSSWGYTASTFYPDSGKWYLETKLSSTNGWFIGVVEEDNTTYRHSNSAYPTSSNGGYALYSDGRKQVTGSSYQTYMVDCRTADAIIGMAIDLENNRLYFSKNGSWSDGDGTADSSTPNAYLTLPASKAFRIFWSSDGVDFSVNFGNPPYAVSSSNNDGKYGNFEYAVPSGYYALCTKRLAEFG